MEELGAAPPQPTEEQLVEQLGPTLLNVVKEEETDQLNTDRIYILQLIYKLYLYFHGLQAYAPAIVQGLADMGTVGGIGNGDEDGQDEADYQQNIYRGFARKLIAVLANRMPNAQCVPDNADDAESILSAEAGQNAAQYIRQHCKLQERMYYLILWIFNAGTVFWHLDWVVDGKKYGHKQVSKISAGSGSLGNAAYVCPQCANAVPAEEGQDAPEECPQCQAPMGPQTLKPATTGIDVPQKTVENVERGDLEITLHNYAEISTQLDVDSIEDTDWLRRDREYSSAKLLAKYGREVIFGKDGRDTKDNSDELNTASLYARQVRAALSSPIGLIKSQSPNSWTESFIWWTTDMYERIEDKDKRELCQQQYPSGLKMTLVRGKLIKMTDESLTKKWDITKGEPSDRIMVDPLGLDWVEADDMYNSALNQCSAIIDRSSQPGFVDATRLNVDAIQQRTNYPAERIPMTRPPGGRLEDSVYDPPPLEFSPQIAPFIQGVVDMSKQNSGILDPMWGGGADDSPTARQDEMKKNASLMQLGIIWSSIGRTLERVYMKGCEIIADHEEGVLRISKQDQFNKYSALPVTIKYLRSGTYHFEADEAVPMSWGQQRDLLMWMLDKPPETLEKWGFNDPLNIPAYKRMLGMPGERIPLADELKAALQIVAKLLEGKPTPGQANPDGSPGPSQPSIQPQWEDNHQFCSDFAKAYMKSNAEIAEEMLDGFENVRLWGQAQESMANVPPAPLQTKTTLAVSLKGQDLGSPAVQAMLNKEGMLDAGTAVESETDKAISMQQQQTAMMQGQVQQNSGNPALTPPADMSTGVQ